MTAYVLPLAALQAGLLLWAAVHLSNIALRPRKVGPSLWALVLLGGALAISHYALAQDRHRVVCTIADCVILAVSVAGIRIFAVNKEEEKLASDHVESRRRAAEAAEAEKLAQLRSTAAALEARIAAGKTPAEAGASRRRTASLIRGGAATPRTPDAPGKP